MPKEKHYVVTWIIDEWADDPIEAAKKALDTMRRHDSSATIFDVTENDTGKTITVDIEDADNPIIMHE